MSANPFWITELEAFINQASPENLVNDHQADYGVLNPFRDQMLVAQAVMCGLPIKLFLLIKNEMPLSDADWAELLGISLKSLQRYKKEPSHVFTHIQTEKVLEFVEVFLFARQVFNDQDKSTLWLSTPSFALGNYKPIELLKNSYGKELVLAELNRIDRGIFV